VEVRIGLKELLLAVVVAFGLSFTALTAASMYQDYYAPRVIDLAAVICYGLFLTAGLGAILYFLLSR